MHWLLLLCLSLLLHWLLLQRLFLSFESVPSFAELVVVVVVSVMLSSFSLVFVVDVDAVVLLFC